MRRQQGHRYEAVVTLKPYEDDNNEGTTDNDRNGFGGPEACVLRAGW